MSKPCCQGSNPTGRLCSDCPSRPVAAAESTDILDPARIARQMKERGTFDRDQPWPGWNAGRKLVEKEPSDEAADEPCSDLPSRRGASSRGSDEPARPAKRGKVDPRDLPVDGLYRTEEQRERIYADAKGFGLAPKDVDDYVRECREAGRPIGRNSLRRRGEQLKGTDKMAAFNNMDFSTLEERVIAHLMDDFGAAAVGTIMHAMLGDECKIDIDDYDQFEDTLTALKETMEKAPPWHKGGLVSGASHDAEFKPGEYVVGTIGFHHMGYNTGPSKWLHPHVTIRKATPPGKTEALMRDVGLTDEQRQAYRRVGGADAAFVGKDGSLTLIDYKSELPRIVFNVQGIREDASEDFKAAMKQFDERILRDMLIKGDAKYELKFTPDGNAAEAFKRLREYCEMDLNVERSIKAALKDHPAVVAEELRQHEHMRRAELKMQRTWGGNTAAECVWMQLQSIGFTAEPTFDATDYEYDEDDDTINVWATWTDAQGHTMCLDVNCDLSYTLERESIAEKEDRASMQVMHDVMDFETYSGHPVTGRWSGGRLPEFMSYGGQQIRRVAEVHDDDVDYDD